MGRWAKGISWTTVSTSRLSHHILKIRHVVTQTISFSLAPHFRLSILFPLECLFLKHKLAELYSRTGSCIKFLCDGVSTSLSRQKERSVNHSLFEETVMDTYVYQVSRHLFL